MTWFHGLAGACALGLALALAGIAWPTIREAASWLATQTIGDSAVIDMAALMAATLRKSLPVAFVAAAFVVLAPLALYFALSDDRGR